MDNNLINEINKLKALIVTLQQQLQRQQTEIFYIFKHIHKKTEPFQMKKEVFEEYDNYVINTPDDTCDNGSLILTLQQQLQTQQQQQLQTQQQQLQTQQQQLQTQQQQLQRQQTEIFYIFKHIHKKTEPFQPIP
jgi:hypothetical protein